jgi:hypothetical protein
MVMADGVDPVDEGEPFAAVGAQGPRHAVRANPIVSNDQ